MNRGAAKTLAVSAEELDLSQEIWATVLREFREACRMDHEDAAEKTGLCPKAVWKIESRLCHPKQETLLKLCKAYGVPFSVAALVVELRAEGIVVPIKRVFRVWRAIRRIFFKMVGFAPPDREKK